MRSSPKQASTTNTHSRSGSVCLDVINQTWSPMFDMINIFEVFLPQLLRYPNPTDPLNGEAAALLMREPKSYDAKVKGRWCGWKMLVLWLSRYRIRHEICEQRSCRRSRSGIRRWRWYVFSRQFRRWRWRPRTSWANGGSLSILQTGLFLFHSGIHRDGVYFRQWMDFYLQYSLKGMGNY